jgi:hypothetical protein
MLSSRTKREEPRRSSNMAPARMRSTFATGGRRRERQCATALMDHIDCLGHHFRHTPEAEPSPTDVPSAVFTVSTTSSAGHNWRGNTWFHSGAEAPCAIPVRPDALQDQGRESRAVAMEKKCTESSSLMIPRWSQVPGAASPQNTPQRGCLQSAVRPPSPAKPLIAGPKER